MIEAKPNRKNNAGSSSGPIEFDRLTRSKLRALARCADMPVLMAMARPGTEDLSYVSMFAWYAELIMPQLLRLGNLQGSRVQISLFRPPKNAWHVKVILDLASPDDHGFGPYRDQGVHEYIIDTGGIVRYADHPDQHMLATWTEVLVSMIRLSAGYKHPDAPYTE